MKTPCIISPHAKDKDGYPRVKWNGRSIPAGRLVMILLYGAETINGKHVLHHCDNPGCVNPEHLYIGDFFQNMQDKVTRGRNPRGLDNPNAKLSDEQVAEIRTMYGTGNYTQKELGEMFNVGQTTISEITTRRRRTP